MAQSIATSVQKLQNALANDKTQLNNKGVSTTTSTKHSNIPNLISKIEQKKHNITIKNPLSSNMTYTLKNMTTNKSYTGTITSSLSGGSKTIEDVDLGTYSLKFTSSTTETPTDTMDLSANISWRPRSIDVIVFFNKGTTKYSFSPCVWTTKESGLIMYDMGNEMYFGTITFTHPNQTYAQLSFDINGTNARYCLLPIADYYHAIVVSINADTMKYSIIRLVDNTAETVYKNTSCSSGSYL